MRLQKNAVRLFESNKQPLWWLASFPSLWERKQDEMKGNQSTAPIHLLSFYTGSGTAAFWSALYFSNCKFSAQSRTKLISALGAQAVCARSHGFMSLHSLGIKCICIGNKQQPKITHLYVSRVPSW